MKHIYLFLLIVSSQVFMLPASAQKLMLDERPPVTENGTLLKYPWAGGLNSPLFNEIDLDGDGIMDLILFDRVSNRLVPFRNTGSANQVSYEYKDKYIRHFPAGLHDWIRTFDYDCDGDLDLFTFTNQAIGIYRNDFTINGGLSFTLIDSAVQSNYGTITNVISGNAANVPAIVDLDQDGDADILTFSNSSSYVEYHRNYAFDSTASCNGFNFYFQPYCWGQFKLSGLANIAFLNDPCRGHRDANFRHAGSVLIAFDQGCDQDYDLLNGDILGDNLLYLQNGGLPDSANITYQDSLFPSYDTIVHLRNLPAPAYTDVNNDGKKDLIVTPSSNSGEDFNNILFYKNITDNCSNQFSYQEDRLIIKDMIDVGTGANPVFYDVDQDGLQDIIVGNDLYFNANTAQQYSSLAYYKNTGTATQPAFTLITRNWLNVLALQQYSLYPAFGDLDGDGDNDLLIGTSAGNLLYYKNNGGTFNYISGQFQNLTVGNNAAPQLIDVDRDGLIDLLAGNRNGKIRYYRNTGTASLPVFTQVTTFFGGVSVLKNNAAVGFASPVLYNHNGSYELLVGSESGNIYQFGNIDGNLNGTFTLIDSAYQQIYEPAKVSLTLTDIDADGKQDLLAGVVTGGLRLYTQSSALMSNPEMTIKQNWKLYPNPSTGHSLLFSNGENGNLSHQISIADCRGQLILQQTFNGNALAIDISKYADGLYIIRLWDANESSTYKLIKYTEK